MNANTELKLRKIKVNRYTA